MEGRGLAKRGQLVRCGGILRRRAAGQGSHRWVEVQGWLAASPPAVVAASAAACSACRRRHSARCSRQRARLQASLQ